MRRYELCSRRSWARPITRTTKAAPPEVSFVIDGLKLSLDEEYQTADRLTAKSRQLFAAALGFFTIVQTVAFNSYESGNINDTEDTWLFGLAAFALFALTAAAAAAVRADSLVPSYQLPVEVAEDALAAIYPERVAPEPPSPAGGAAPAAERGSALRRLITAIDRRLRLQIQTERAVAPPPEDLTRNSAPGYIASYYAGLVELRRKENDDRRIRYLLLRVVVAASIATTAIELFAALWYRVP